MATIYVDLDGTIIDIAERYWRLHGCLTARLGGPVVHRDRYWEMKRRRATISEIWVECPPQLAELYNREWLQ